MATAERTHVSRMSWRGVQGGTWSAPEPKQHLTLSAAVNAVPEPLTRSCPLFTNTACRLHQLCGRADMLDTWLLSALAARGVRPDRAAFRERTRVEHLVKGTAETVTEGRSHRPRQEGRYDIFAGNSVIGHAMFARLLWGIMGIMARRVPFLAFRPFRAGRRAARGSEG